MFIFSDTECEIPPTLLRGKLECYDARNTTQNQLVITQCKLTCHTGYVRNWNIQEIYTCEKEKLWNPPFFSGFTNMACISK